MLRQHFFRLESDTKVILSNFEFNNLGVVIVERSFLTILVKMSESEKTL